MEAIWKRLLDPAVLFFMVPIVAIIGGITMKILKMVIAHQERIAMIRHGIHPDYPPDDLQSESNNSVKR